MFDDLNPEQRAAVLFGDGPLLIVAGAGTGKTSTLASRVGHLVERGVRPERILLLTFSRRAAREMLSRAERVSGHRDTAHVWGGTFHAVANRLHPAARTPARPASGLHGARPGRRRRRDEPAPRGARVRHEGAAVPAQGHARVDLLAHGERRREAGRRPEAPLPVVHRRGRRHPAGVPGVHRPQARAERPGLRRPAAVLEGARHVAADARTARVHVRSRAGRRVPGHERAAGRHPGGHAAGGHAAQHHRGRRRRAIDLRVPRRDRAQHPGVPHAVRGRHRDPPGAELPLDHADPRRDERRDRALAATPREDALVRTRGRADAGAPHVPGRGRAVRLRVPQRACGIARRAWRSSSRPCCSAPRITRICSRWSWRGATSRS